MKTYEPFDPFEALGPTKTLIQDVYKDLIKEAQALQDAQRSLNEPWQDWVVEILKDKQQQLLKRARYYRLRLNNYDKKTGWNKPQAKPGGVTAEDIAQARTVPISDYFEGKLKRSGSRLLGSCPFGTHQDSSPSFVIYVDQNSFSCFGCSETGDVIDYIKKTKNLKFIDAIKLLTNK